MIFSGAFSYLLVHMEELGLGSKVKQALPADFLVLPVKYINFIDSNVPYVLLNECERSSLHTPSHLLQSLRIRAFYYFYYSYNYYNYNNYYSTFSPVKSLAEDILT